MISIMPSSGQMYGHPLPRRPKLQDSTKGPWLGGDNLEKKAEYMVGMLQCICCDPLEMANHADGRAFDQGLALPPVHSGHDVPAVAHLTVKDLAGHGILYQAVRRS